MERISSTQNPRIKRIKKLDKPAERRAAGLFIAEGLREVTLAMRGGYTFQELYYCPELLNMQNLEYPAEAIFNALHPAQLIEVTQAVYQTMAYRESTEGILAIGNARQHGLLQLQLPENPLILVIEAVEKPGNLGAMLRTCDAVGVDAIIVCDEKTDVYNSNVIRSSLGTVFTNAIAVCTTEDAISFLRQQAVNTYAASPDADGQYFEANYQEPTAFIVGTEATGLSEVWMQAADKGIRIPMLGRIDSLNVSVSAAVLLYEARRQRIAAM